MLLLLDRIGALRFSIPIDMLMHLYVHLCAAVPSMSSTLKLLILHLRKKSPYVGSNMLNQFLPGIGLVGPNISQVCSVCCMKPCASGRVFTGSGRGRTGGALHRRGASAHRRREDGRCHGRGQPADAQRDGDRRPVDGWGEHEKRVPNNTGRPLERRLTQKE